MHVVLNFENARVRCDGYDKRRAVLARGVSHAKEQCARNVRQGARTADITIEYRIEAGPHGWTENRFCEAKPNHQHAGC